MAQAQQEVGATATARVGPSETQVACVAPGRRRQALEELFVREEAAAAVHEVHHGRVVAVHGPLPPRVQPELVPEAVREHVPRRRVRHRRRPAAAFAAIPAIAAFAFAASSARPRPELVGPRGQVPHYQVQVAEGPVAVASEVGRKDVAHGGLELDEVVWLGGEDLLNELGRAGPLCRVIDQGVGVELGKAVQPDLDEAHIGGQP